MRFKKILISAVAALMGMTVLTSCGERSELRLGTGKSRWDILRLRYDAA